MVQNEGKSIGKASEKLGIKCSTGKLIIKRYKQTGLFFLKRKNYRTNSKAEKMEK